MEKARKDITIYPAASLFNGRETFFNSHLIERLENKGYKTNFPQRDGYEFGDLSKTLSKKLPENQVSSTVESIIYFLDMGHFLPKSDVIVANFDEAPDQGVDNETAYGKLIGKPVIGLRTDVRSPYGTPDNKFKGMHFFPAKQSNIFIPHYMPCKTPEQRDKEMKTLVDKIDSAIQESVTPSQKLPKYATNNPHISSLLKGAEILFSNLKNKNLNSKESIEEIAKRYIKNKEWFDRTEPEIKI